MDGYYGYGCGRRYRFVRFEWWLSDSVWNVTLNLVLVYLLSWCFWNDFMQSHGAKHFIVQFNISWIQKLRAKVNIEMKICKFTFIFPLKRLKVSLFCVRSPVPVLVPVVMYTFYNISPFVIITKFNNSFVCSTHFGTLFRLIINLTRIRAFRASLADKANDIEIIQLEVRTLTFSTAQK